MYFSYVLAQVSHILIQLKRVDNMLSSLPCLQWLGYLSPNNLLHECLCLHFFFFYHMSMLVSLSSQHACLLHFIDRKKLPLHKIPHLSCISSLNCLACSPYFLSSANPSLGIKLPKTIKPLTIVVIFLYIVRIIYRAVSPFLVHDLDIFLSFSSIKCDSIISGLPTFVDWSPNLMTRVTFMDNDSFQHFP
jgi:hypothetical protein